MGGLYLFERGSGVVGAGEAPANVQEVHPESQLCAHVKHQLCCGHSLGKGLGLQATAAEVEAEGTDPVSAGFDRPPESRGNTALGAASHTPSQARPTEPFLGSKLPQFGPNKFNPSESLPSPHS